MMRRRLPLRPLLWRGLFDTLRPELCRRWKRYTATHQRLRKNRRRHLPAFFGRCKPWKNPRGFHA